MYWRIVADDLKRVPFDRIQDVFKCDMFGGTSKLVASAWSSLAFDHPTFTKSLQNLLGILQV